MTVKLRWTGGREIISIHMPHTWHDELEKSIIRTSLISIHMPHTWHDIFLKAHDIFAYYFNPHATYVA